MKIVTVYIPVYYLKKIDKLLYEDEYKTYPSRSELIRHAVRKKIKKEINYLKTIHIFKNEKELDNFPDEKYIKIPVDKVNKDEPIREFKTYKIIKKLDY